MRISGNVLTLSATDLSAHLGCHHQTQLNLLAARGELKRPYYNDPTLELLRQKGLEHEAEYLAHLKAQGLVVVELPEHMAKAADTLSAMLDGADVIFQAALDDGCFRGRADFLLKTDGSSALGEYHYEVVDTKLARETRAGTVLQLCLYAELVGNMQARRPDRVMVVSPGKHFEPEAFRVDHFDAYYQLVKGRLAEAVGNGAAPDTYPEPCAQCDVCNWSMVCREQREVDDHLSLVAGISKVQRTELKEWGITTLTELGEAQFPADKRPKRGTRQGLDKVQDQARVQLEGRRGRHPYHEALPAIEGEGLTRLPEPNEGDVFFDIEGDAFAGDTVTEGAGGLEYLFGWHTVDGGYTGLWAYSPAAEHQIFEQFIDAMVERRRRFPDMHIYHFAPYEPAALKRLMGRYATREDEVDDLLRNRVFVDLYAVTRQGVRCSVESYSIKRLEEFYDFQRQEALPELGRQKRHFEAMLEGGEGEQAPLEMRDIVQRYNEDDCVSTWALREWLEEVRARIVADGGEVPRPVVVVPEESEQRQERDQRLHDMRERLIGGVSPVRSERTEEQQARWLLAYMLDWHWREEKAAWWEYFRLRELADEDYLDEKAAITGLEYVKELPKEGKERRKRHRYSYPEQITEIRVEAKLRDGAGESFGEVIAIDHVAQTIDILKATKRAADHPLSIYAHSVVPGAVLEQSLMRMAEWIVEQGTEAMNGGPESLYRAGRDLLLNLPPRLCAAAELHVAHEEGLATGQRLALALDGGVLPIQGPPGSGKTYTGGHMIAALVKAGKRVGVTAVSHKVITNLLTAAVEAAADVGVPLTCVQKIGQYSEAAPQGIEECDDNDTPLQMLDDGAAQVVGGTAWMWVREEYANAVDVLFVDEAGQMSLANVLAVSPCARSVVLLGDPQQLEQPQQGSHPEGTEVSALQHVLGGYETMPAERGLFLEKTWRLHPSICAYTSKLFYEGKLASKEGLDQQVLAGPTKYAGAGLWVEPVAHEGNQGSSKEEVERVAEIVSDLLQPGVTWTNRKGETVLLEPDDILIVAPYNAQVAALQERLGPGARVGTVDKFQGQEAPVVIYSMATSSPEEAPRGMEFLYSLNRLNVATSRARCVCVLVAEPRLFEPECRSVRQMRLANGVCEVCSAALNKEPLRMHIKGSP